MIIRMLRTAAGPDGVYSDGSVQDLSEKMAKAFIAAGAAVLIGQPAPTVVAPPAIESAAISPPEMAVLPRPQPRKR